MKRVLSGAILTALALSAALFAAPDKPQPEPAEDDRPFGKYLVKVCELGRGCYDPADSCKISSCAPVKNKQGKLVPKPCALCDPVKEPQTIDVKQVGCPGTVSACGVDAVYPLRVGQTFYIKATAALPVTQSVEGPATLADPTHVSPVNGIQGYTVTGEGTVTVKAVQPGDTTHLTAPTATITLRTSDKPSPSCYGLYTKPVVSADPPDIAAILALAGNPTPFVLTTQGTGTILVYATRMPILKAHHEDEILQRVVDTLDGPLGSDPAKSFGIKPPAAKPASTTQELEITHARALADPAKRINALGYDFSATNIGTTPGSVRITIPGTATCKDWTTFLEAVRDLEWSVSSEPQVTKLWFLSADDTSKAMGTAFPSGGGGSPAPALANSPSPGGSSPPSGGGSPGASGAASVSVNQPAGSKLEIKSDTTPCLAAGLVTGNSNACAPSASAPASAPASGKSGDSAPNPNPIPPAQQISVAPIGIPNSTPPAGTLPQSPTDMLLYGNPIPGDDAQIGERNRILAQLDLPHPEMIINAWIMQNSSSDPRSIGEFTRQVRRLVERYNGSLEELVFWAYNVVSIQMVRPTYFNQAFLHYISDKFVAEGETEPTDAQQFLTQIPTQLAESRDRRTGVLGICEKERYCLGYSWLFHPSKPRLTDLLLALIAAADPPGAALETINAVQGTNCCCPPSAQPCPTKPKSAAPPTASTGVQCVDCLPCINCAPPPDSRGDIEEFSCEKHVGNRRASERCSTLAERLALKPVLNYLNPNFECSVADQWGILQAQYRKLQNQEPGPPRVFLACFARAAQKYLKDAGIPRVAVADFLFNYKRSQQYPHEFTPYYLSQSAANLNSALSPMIDAFNRDVVAYQSYMRADMEFEVEMANRSSDSRCCVKKLFGINKPSFFNDGIVSVRTVSGQAASVSATSQSFLDASKAPTLSDLLNAVGANAAPTSASPLAAVLGTAASQAPISLLSGLAGAYQRTYAQIGRQLQLQAVPRSLATASAAEISVSMTASDSASQPLFTGGPQSATQQNTSQVSNHQVTSRVRIDSVKLFELSSYSAVLQRSRSKIPIVPPFLELPYIGSIVGIPLPAAKEYHESTAVISAMVAPTAWDVGYGLRFAPDLVLYGPPGRCFYDGLNEKPCKIKPAISWRDLHAPVEYYHQAMMVCLATETHPGREGYEPATTTGQKLYTVGPGGMIQERLQQQNLNHQYPSLARGTCENISFKQQPGQEESPRPNR